MATVEEIAPPLAEICVPVPAVQAEVCAVCHGSSRPGRPTCWSCADLTDSLSQSQIPVVPVSLCTKTDSQLYYLLCRYKSAYTSPRDRRSFSVKLIALLAFFLEKHGRCLSSDAGRALDTITVVPSSGEREGQHPLYTALQMVIGLPGQLDMVLRRGPGVLGFNQGSDDGYVPVRDVRGERVTIVDDTFTTGARSRSAASALARAGAIVPAIVPIGRLVNPGYNEATAAYWAAQTAAPFSFEACCLEAR